MTGWPPARRHWPRVRSLGCSGASKVVLAVPIAAERAVAELRRVVDEVVCVDVPPDFRSVGQWYDDFSQTTDDEVEQLLDQFGR